MGVPIDPGMAALFGSATRARTLAVLANSPEPLTGYRIAEVSGDERIKVYSVLASLAKTGVVTSAQRDDGRAVVWTLRDSDIRSLLRRRVRLVGEGEWDAGVARRLSERKVVRDRILEIDLSKYPSLPREVVRELERPPRKDRELVAAGLRPSRRRKP